MPKRISQSIQSIPHLKFQKMGCILISALLLFGPTIVIYAQDSVTISMYSSTTAKAADSVAWTLPADSQRTLHLDYKITYKDTTTGMTYRMAIASKSGCQKYDLLLVIESPSGRQRRIKASEPENPEFMDASIHFLKGQPFFFVKNHYQFYLVDIRGETISPFMQPGIDVEYREDAVSGNISGFQFFDNDNYLLGNAQGYGVFCFNITDITNPVELFRYSAGDQDDGQPYFFLEIDPDTYNWSGFVTCSDTLQRSLISRLYRSLKKPRYLFKDMALLAPTAHYTDPFFQPLPKLWMLRAQPNVDSAKWLVVDLVKGELTQPE